MFGQGMLRVVANVHDGDAAYSAGCEVYVVDAGSGDGDELEVVQMREFGFADAKLVAHRDARPAQSFNDFALASRREINPLVREVWAAKLRFNCRAFKKDDAMHLLRQNSKLQDAKLRTGIYNVSRWNANRSGL